MRTLRRLAPLLALVAIEFAWCVFLAVTHRIPRGHDGFQYFYLKYYFFNDFVQNGEVAEWLPYLTHGSPSSWWFVVQSGIFDPVAMVVARFLRVHSFFPVFYTLLLLERTLLVVGTWLLAREHLRSRPAIFAITAAVTGTSIWFTQPWWNYHAVLALPMMLFLLHRAILDFRWRWLVGLSLLLFLQTFGHLSYYLPMTLLMLAVYGGIALTEPGAWRALRARFHIRLAGLLACVAVNGAFLVALVWLRDSSADIAFGQSQRSADGSVTLATFLNYAGYTDLRGWNGFFTGLTPHLDFTLFGGFLVTAFALLACCAGRRTRAQKLFGWLAVTTVLISTASPLATMVFFFWPLAKLFRHLALLAPAAKLFCVFLAGATFDRLVCAGQGAGADGDRPEGSEPIPWVSSAMVLVALTAWLVLLVVFATSPASARSFIAALTTDTLPVATSYATTAMEARLIRGIVFLTLSVAAFASMVLRGARGPGSAGGNARSRTRRLAWMSALVLVVDVAAYGAFELEPRTLSLTPREAEIFQFTALPYAEQRMRNAEEPENRRRQNVLRVVARSNGVSYWAENLLWFADTYSTTNRTVYWSRALETLLQARSGGNTSRLIGPDETLALPTNDTLLAAVGGLSVPKARLLQHAIACADQAATATLFNHPAYVGPVGNVALLTGTVEGARPCDASSLTAAAGEPLRPAAVRTAGFTSNSVTFDVQNATNGPAVLTYSDSWSDRWRARLDDRPTNIYRSNLAYKAVVVPPGTHRIVFGYEDRMAEVVFATQGAASLGFCVFLGFLGRWVIKEPDEP